ncbi:hypothetical protein D3C80_2043280 [compost metagenome]
MYIDSASRSGMSGSPVIYIERRPIALLNTDYQVESRNRTKIVGIYSGRIGAQDELLAQLGIVWKFKVVDEIVNNKMN